MRGARHLSGPLVVIRTVVGDIALRRIAQPLNLVEVDHRRLD